MRRWWTVEEERAGVIVKRGPMRTESFSVESFFEVRMLCSSDARCFGNEVRFYKAILVLETDSFVGKGEFDVIICRSSPSSESSIWLRIYFLRCYIWRGLLKRCY